MGGVGDLRRDVGLRLRELREGLGISQEELAARADLHRNYVGSVERGERDLGLSALDRLVTALGTSLADFFTDLRRPGRARRS